MARFLVYSDLHYELGGTFEPPSHLRGTIDGVILAGDIAAGSEVMMYARHLSRLVNAPAVLVAGNHEFYGGIMEPRIDDLRAQSDDEVHFLERESVVIGGTRILGTTLWTDFALNPDKKLRAFLELRKVMNDYRWIKRLSDTRGTRKIDTRWVLALHLEQRNWLTSELTKDFDGPTIVVTHHAPSRRSLAKRDANRTVAAAYASDLEALVNDHRIAAWVHGHIHDSVDYMIGETRVVSNPYGYQIERRNPHFTPDFMLDV